MDDRMNYKKSIWVMLLILCSSILVTPLTSFGAISADANRATGSLQMDDPNQDNGEHPEKAIRIYSKVDVPGDAPNLENGHIRVAVPKNTVFKAVTNQDITTSAASLKQAEVTDDANNYYIDYYLNTVGSGSSVALPFSVYFKKPNENQKSGVITQTILDSQNNVLDTMTKTLTVQTQPNTYYTYDTTRTYGDGEIDTNGKSKSDVSVTMSIYSRQYYGEDERDQKISIILPNNIDFNTANAGNWVYDPATRTASMIIHAGASVPVLPITIKAGVPVPGSDNLKMVTTYVNPKVGEQPDSQDITYNYRRVSPVNDSVSKRVTFGSDWQMDAKKIDANTELQSIITPNVGSENHRLSSLTDENNDDMTSYTVQSGAVLNGSLTADQKVNQLVGTTLDGQTVILANNLDNGRINFKTDQVQSYKSLKLTFTNATELNNSLNLTIFSKFKMDQVQAFKTSDSTRQQLTDLARADYSGNTVSSSDYGYMTKSIPTVSGYSISLDNKNLYKGQISNIDAEFSLSNFNNTNVNLKNPRVTFIVPNGAELAKGDNAKIKGLKDVSVQNNINGTGKTAITGTPTMDLNANSYPEFNVPIQANNNLRLGQKYPVEVYLTFTNNDGNYTNYGSDNMTSAMTKNINDLYNLTANTNAPGKAASLTSDFNYNPPRELITSKSVKGQGADDFVSDTGLTEDAGSVETYRLNAFNNGLDDVKNFGLIDVLPHVTDKNGSQFKLNLKSKINIDDANYQDKFNIYYSTDKPSGDTSTLYNHAKWVTDPTDLSKVTMIKITLKDGEKLKSGDEVNFDFEAQIPNDLTIKDGAKAVNIFESTTNEGQTFIDSPSATTSVNYKTSAVNVTKVAVQDPNLKLAHAKYQLYDYDTDQLLNDGKEYETDENGQFTIDHLKPGHYYMRETVAPDGYLIAGNATTEKQQTQFEIVRNQTDATAVTYTDVPKHSLEIDKIDTKSQKALADAEFELKDQAGNLIAKQVKTDAFGQAFVYDLKPGTYDLKETKAPVGYKLNQKIFKIEVKDDTTLIKQEVEDQAIAATMVLKKVDQGTKNPLTGAKFLLSDDDPKTKDQTLTSDAAGMVSAVNLTAGKYTIKEIAAPDGYELAANSKSFTVDSKTDQIDLGSVDNKRHVDPIVKGTVHVKYVDEKGHEIAH